MSGIMKIEGFSKTSCLVNLDERSQNIGFFLGTVVYQKLRRKTRFGKNTKKTKHEPSLPKRDRVWKARAVGLKQPPEGRAGPPAEGGAEGVHHVHRRRRHRVGPSPSRGFHLCGKYGGAIGLLVRISLSDFQKRNIFG